MMIITVAAPIIIKAKSSLCLKKKSWDFCPEMRENKGRRRLRHQAVKKGEEEEEEMGQVFFVYRLPPRRAIAIT